MNEVEQASELRQHYEEKCAKAYLTPEQTAQVVDFRTDPWWCNDDRQADVIISFFRRQNEHQFEDMSDPSFNSHPAALGTAVPR